MLRNASKIKSEVPYRAPFVLCESGSLKDIFTRIRFIDDSREWFQEILMNIIYLVYICPKVRPDLHLRSWIDN